jgi:tRNA-dihydrouridine synthase B
MIAKLNNPLHVPSTAGTLRALLERPGPLLALAPMQDVTDHAFMSVFQAYGGADFYVTEYFRVHSASTLRRNILRCITENPTGQPVIAQLAGRDLPAITRTACDLQRYPIGAVDFNLGCPAPIVCRKRAGGALLRELDLVDAILGALRECVTVPLTVKTRIGYEDPKEFPRLLAIFAKHHLDMVVVHGRTVRQLYGGQVRYDCIAEAVRTLTCPVIANGDIDSPRKALDILRQTGARGIMMGRAAVRNPWLFHQIRQRLNAEAITCPTGREVGGYLKRLFTATSPTHLSARDQVDKFKKYLNFIGPGLPNAPLFLHDARRLTTVEDLDALVQKYLAHDEPLRLEPFK